jgi:hypothetical protein
MRERKLVMRLWRIHLHAAMSRLARRQYFFLPETSREICVDGRRGEEKFCFHVTSPKIIGGGREMNLTSEFIKLRIYL